jgi:general L-amino acid transport system permease protein
LARQFAPEQQRREQIHFQLAARQCGVEIDAGVGLEHRCVVHHCAQAAAALGLSRGQTMRLVSLPQALRVIIPPMTNQYLNLTKNSSLAVAIGYPDVVSIANTAINQTGRAVECIALIMLVYLTTSLLTSLLMNWSNARAAIQER